VKVLISIDQVIGEQRVDELGAALGDEVRAVFLLQALHGVRCRARALKPAQPVSTSPERETTYFFATLNALATPPAGASSL